MRWKEDNLLREFSMPRTIALQKHRSDAEELILHLFKVYFYSNTLVYKHWLREVEDRSNYTYKLKTKNKYLTKEEILNCWLGPIETEEEFNIFYRVKIRNIAEEYNDLKDITKKEIIENEEAVKKFTFNYLSWASEKLSKNGYIEKEDIENKIRELLEEE